MKIEQLVRSVLNATRHRPVKRSRRGGLFATVLTIAVGLFELMRNSQHRRKPRRRHF